MAYKHEGNMVNEFPVSGWKEYWESLIDENTALRTRVARLEEALKEIVDEYEHPTGCVIDGAEMGQIAYRALVEAVHNAMGRTADCDKKQTNEQLVSDIIYLKRLLTEAQTRNNYISLILSNIKIHFDRLCSEDIRVHGFISPDHDIDFQVFRLLCGYRELLDWQKESAEALRFYAAEDKVSVNDGILGSVYDRPATKILEKK